jgi:hypothetical protein
MWSLDIKGRTQRGYTELYNLHTSPNIVWVVKWGGACGTHRRREEKCKYMDIDGRLIFEWISNKTSGHTWIE